MSFFCLSNKLSTKLNKFFAYKFDAVNAKLFNIFFAPIIFIPFTRLTLSASEKAATNRAKAKGNKAGKQFVKQPKNIAKKTARYR